MSIARTYAHNSSPAFERRLRVRQRLSDLAYLDIGEDNGGIVLNLTDDGMGFQAVAPLGDQKEINLRIQLPCSRTRIETTARIIWLGPENRQAGVRFLEMPPEVRAQIRQWIDSLLPPDEPVEGAAHRTEASSDSVRRHEPAPPARKNKWLTLMGECKNQKQHIENPPPVDTNAERVRNDPIGQQDPPPLEPQHNALADSAPPDFPIHAGLSEETPLFQPAKQLDASVYRLQLNIHPLEAAGSLAGAATGHHNPSPGEYIDWPIRAPQIAPPGVHDDAQKSLVPPIPSAAPPVTSAIPSPKLAVGKADAIPISLPPAADGRARTWIAVFVILIGVSVLCFEIGTWIGHRGSHSQIAHLPTEPAVASPVAQPDSRAGNHSSASTPLNADRRKVLNEDTRTRYVPERRQPQVSLAANSQRLQSISETTPAKANSPLPTAVKPPEIRSASPPAPAVAESADPPPIAPRIIAGRKLRPTDRYNSCHLSYRVEPEYPVAAKQQQIEGAVKIHQVIKADGSVQSVKLISGPPLLAPAALEAAKYWRYFPALLNGQPVEAELDVEIDFRLPH